MAVAAAAPLPASWEAVESADGVYYWNTATDETSWERPEGEEAPCEHEAGCAPAEADAASVREAAPHAEAASSPSSTGATQAVSKVAAAAAAAQAAYRGGLQVVGHGVGSVPEMASLLDDSQVAFALLRFEVGSGAFAREKYVGLALAGPDCAAVRRGRGTARRAEVLQAFGACHLEYEAAAVSEVTVDAVLEALLRACVSDHGLGGLSLGVLREALEEQLAAARRREVELSSCRGGNGEDAPKPTRPTAKELGVELERALRLVRSPTGALNWVLVRNEGGVAALDDAGGGSVPELAKALADDAVQFGVVRMSFGAGRFRRTKWIFVHWLGPSCGALRRGRDNAALGSIRPALGPTSADLQADERQEMELEAVIDRVRRIFVVDGDIDAEEAAAVVSVEAFNAALKEDEARMRQEFGLPDDGEDGAAKGGGVPLPSLGDAVAKIRNKSDPTNWLLVRAA